MSKNSSIIKLRQRIRDLEQTQNVQGQELETQLYKTLDSLRPANIVRGMFSNLMQAAKPSIANAVAIISTIASVYTAVKSRNDDGSPKSWLQSFAETISRYFSES